MSRPPKTGWPPGLLQDDCKALSEWFASQPDARRRVREALAEMARVEYRAKLAAMPIEKLHELRLHPDFEYATTEGQRKAWYDSDVPPEGDGWVRNIHAGRDGWERFDYTEESYWMRPRPAPPA